MFNKFMKGLLSISACMCLVGSPVLAAESNGISDEGKEYYQSEEYQKVLEEKVANSNDKQRRATTILSVPHYTQETSYYCGPASAQVLIKYVTGTYYEQDYLASRMGTSSSYGTYVDALTPVIKSLTGLDYEFTDNHQYYFYKNMVQDINGDCPIIYDVDPYYFYNGYGHMGHYVVGNGYGDGDLCYYWDVNGGFAYQWHIAAEDMSVALNANGGYYVW